MSAFLRVIERLRHWLYISGYLDVTKDLKGTKRFQIYVLNLAGQKQ